jgi:hypothetical protein
MFEHFCASTRTNYAAMTTIQLFKLGILFYEVLAVPTVCCAKIQVSGDNIKPSSTLEKIVGSESSGSSVLKGISESCKCVVTGSSSGMLTFSNANLSVT